MIMESITILSLFAPPVVPYAHEYMFRTHVPSEVVITQPLMIDVEKKWREAVASQVIFQSA